MRREPRGGRALGLAAVAIVSTGLAGGLALAGCGSGGHAGGGGGDPGGGSPGGGGGPGTIVDDGPAKDLVRYGAAEGLPEPLVDASPDEGANVWAVSSGALYVKRRGADTFRRYGNADGLHVWKAITAVAGGRADEAYVGLLGNEPDDPSSDPMPMRQLGKAEHVRLHGDGSISSVHYADLHNDDSANYWETRSARRLLFVHDGPAAGHLFMGGNHGITHILGDHWGDHVHVDVREPSGSQLLGEWLGLAVEPATGELWTCGRYACGVQEWSPDPHAWVGRPYRFAFTVTSADHDLQVPHGWHEDHVGVAIGADGIVYVLSRTSGLWSWDPRTSNYQTIARRTVPGLGAPVDVVADPDGSLWLADDQHVVRWTPSTGAVSTPALGGGAPRRLAMDTARHPRALYVATDAGLVIYRGK